jgi:hypothetical protein
MVCLLVLSAVLNGCCARKTVDVKRLIHLIAIGDSKTAVSKKIGFPDAKRIGQLGEVGYGDEFWLYGTSDPRMFATKGIIVFDKEEKVAGVFEPEKPSYVNRFQNLKKEIWRNQGTSGVELRIVSLELREQSSGPEARCMVYFTLRNDGMVGLKIASDSSPLWTSIAVGIFNAKNDMVYFKDFIRYHKGELHDVDFNLPPGDELSGAFSLWFNDVYYGALSNGEYEVRLFAMDENKKVIVSSPMKWIVNDVWKLDPLWPEVIVK